MIVIDAQSDYDYDNDNDRRAACVSDDHDASV